MLYFISHVLVCLDLGYVCHAMCYCSPFVPFISFSCVLAYWFGPDLNLWSLSSSIHLGPYQRVWMIPYLHVYACLLLWFILMLASLVLGFAMLGALSRFVVVWLHLTPMRPCLGVTIWDASPRCQLLCAYLSPFCSVRWYAYHACWCHPLASYASLHTCLHVHAWVLLASVSSMLQQNEVMDIRSKPTFVPHRHHLLFAFSLVCLLSCLFILWLVMSPTICYVCHVYHAYLLHASFICSLHLSFPLLVCWFLFFAFACTYMGRGCMKLGHGLLGTSKKG